MSETEHTPGPWCLTDDEPPCVVACVANPHGFEEVICVGFTGEKSRINARLAAAAPEMRELLAELISVETVDGYNQYQRARIVRKAMGLLTRIERENRNDRNG